jgi:hypothetical protein
MTDKTIIPAGKLKSFSFHPPFKEFPKDNRQTNHAETKKKILQRDASDPYPEEKLFVVHDYPGTGKITVDQEFKTQNYKQEQVKELALQEIDSRHPIDEDCQDHGKGSDQCIFFHFILSLIYFNASQVKIQQNGTTIKKSHSSTGRLTIYAPDTPAGSKYQCLRQAAKTSQPPNIITTMIRENRSALKLRQNFKGG